MPRQVSDDFRDEVLKDRHLHQTLRCAQGDRTLRVTARSG
jgi:hypothetical protein